MRPVSTPSSTPSVFASATSSPSRAFRRSVKNVKPPETSAVMAPAALNPASIRVAPGEMRSRSS